MSFQKFTTLKLLHAKETLRPSFDEMLVSLVLREQCLICFECVFMAAILFP